MKIDLTFTYFECLCLQVPGYTLEVQAVDSGHPRLTGVVRVAIEILDANDNAPQFTLDNYTAVVQVTADDSPLRVTFL